MYVRFTDHLLLTWTHKVQLCRFNLLRENKIHYVQYFYCILYSLCYIRRDGSVGKLSTGQGYQQGQFTRVSLGHWSD